MPNLLASEPSAYLKSAAHQPGHWHPWGEPAFARARAEAKPILLDIGAQGGHWCHVLDGESYGDPEAATRLNDAFVCIKVDSDERPDVGTPYPPPGPACTAVQLPLRRVRHGAQIPPPRRVCLPPGPLARLRGRLDARGGGEDAHRDGAGRDPRPCRWRVPPLLRR